MFTLLLLKQEARASGSQQRLMDTSIRQEGQKLEDLIPGLSVRELWISHTERSWELFAEADRWYDLAKNREFLTLVLWLRIMYSNKASSGQTSVFPDSLG